jgi:glucokinase
MILAGDIGGTKTLLAAFDGDTCVFKQRYGSHDFQRFADLLARFLDEAAGALGAARPFRAACLGIAGPVIGEHVKVTNLPWEIDARALGDRFDLKTVRLLNDFAAAAHGIDALQPADLVTLQAGEPLPQRPRVIIGAGTGLGVAYALGPTVFSGEGGHMSFAPANAQQSALWRWLQARVGRVEVEHVVCGAGQVRIYEYLLEQRTQSAGDGASEVLQEEDPARAITVRALEQHDSLAQAAVSLFIDCYGSLAGDHALAVLARGGVFVGGGIAPKLLPRLRAGGFLAAFNDKGAFAEVTRACPVHVVVNPELPLLGAARFAQRALTAV